MSYNKIGDLIEKAPDSNDYIPIYRTTENKTYKTKVSNVGGGGSDSKINPQNVGFTVEDGVVIKTLVVNENTTLNGGTHSGINTGDQTLASLQAEDVNNKSNDISSDYNSITKYPSVKAIKDYADSLTTGLLDYRGVYDASSNVYPSTGGSGTAGAIMQGDTWVISVSGTLGGVAVSVGDSIIAASDTPGQTATNWNLLSTSIGYTPENSANKVTSINGSSTNSQYPSAKLLYDQLALKGTGTVTAISVANANGFSATSSGGATPALTISAGAITPSSVNGVVISGTSSPTLAVTGTTTVSGSNTGDQTNVSGSSGSCTGNAATATKLAATKTINGVAFDGSANITVPSNITPGTIGNVLTSNGVTWESSAPSSAVPTAITAGNEASDTSCYPLFAIGATGDVSPKTNAGLTFNSATGVLTTTLNGNVTGNITGSSGSCTGNSATVTGLAVTSGKLLSSEKTLTFTGTDGTTMTFPGTSQSVVGETTTQTLTNKRITKRVVTATDDATAVIDTDITDIYELNAIANATEFTLSGTPTDGQTLIIRYKDAGVAKGLTFTGFTALGVVIPTTTITSKWCYVGCIYNSAASTWHVVAVSQEV